MMAKIPRFCKTNFVLLYLTLLYVEWLSSMSSLMYYRVQLDMKLRHPIDSEEPFYYF